MTMCFQFSMLNIYHAYGCHLKGKAIIHRVVCYSVGPLYINNMQPSFNSLFLKKHTVYKIILIIYLGLHCCALPVIINSFFLFSHVLIWFPMFPMFQWCPQNIYITSPSSSILILWHAISIPQRWNGMGSMLPILIGAKGLFHLVNLFKGGMMFSLCICMNGWIFLLGLSPLFLNVKLFFLNILLLDFHGLLLPTFLIVLLFLVFLPLCFGHELKLCKFVQQIQSSKINLQTAKSTFGLSWQRFKNITMPTNKFLNAFNFNCP